MVVKMFIQQQHLELLTQVLVVVEQVLIIVVLLLVVEVLVFVYLDIHLDNP